LSKSGSISWKSCSGALFPRGVTTLPARILAVPRQAAHSLTFCIISAAVLFSPGPCAAAPQSEPGLNLLPPVRSACISSPFGPRILPNRPLAGTYHYGVDLAAPAGAAVFATAPGKVVRIHRMGPGGLEVIVQHDGFLAIYSHLGMVTPALAEGKTSVAAGEKLGVVGHSGLTYGMHLFFEIKLAGRPVDPAPYLGLPPCKARGGSSP